MYKAYSKSILIIVVIATVIVCLFVSGWGMYLAAESKVYWCRDFKSMEEAQNALDTGEEKYSRLDGNGNGKACETYVYTKNKKIQVK
jgi:hypothetical protein